LGWKCRPDHLDCYAAKQHLQQSNRLCEASGQRAPNGVHLVICSMCLNHHRLEDQVEVGVVGGMIDIIEAQWRADKVITFLRRSPGEPTE
jgi:hypothetical protein